MASLTTWNFLPPGRLCGGFCRDLDKIVEPGREGLRELGSIPSAHNGRIEVGGSDVGIPSRKCFSGVVRQRPQYQSTSSNGQTLDMGPVLKGVTDAPLLETLRECGEQDTATFHFPGHGRGTAAPPDLLEILGHGPFRHDLPELPELDNLFAPEGAIRDAQAKAANLFGADDTFFLVNGSTCGIQAAVMATCGTGQYLVLPRSCHMSAVSGMVLSGALPKYVMPVYDSLWGIAHGVSPIAVDDAICEIKKTGGRVGAVLVVSPTYFGVCSDVASIARVCHLHGVPLILDEAHGAHFKFHQDFPPTGLEQGADLAVQSTHKVLGSFTQSAMLHLRGPRVSKERVRRCLQVLQSSSPSYLLLSSLDAARAHISQAGTTAFADAIALAQDAREALKAIPGIHVLDEERVNYTQVGEMASVDPLRITIGLWELGMTGFEADDILRLEHGVIAELPLLRSITFALHAGTSRRDVQRLVHSVKLLPSRSQQPSIKGQGLNLAASAQSYLSLVSAFGMEFESGSGRCWGSPQRMSPREAFFAETEMVSVEMSLGRVSAELLCPYPPGIPLIAPGEVITSEALGQLRAVLQAGGSVSGACDSSLATMSVLRE